MSQAVVQTGRLAARIRRITVLGRVVTALALLWVIAQVDPYTDPILGGYKTWALGEVAVMVLAWLVTAAWLWQVRSNAELVEPDSQSLGRSFVVTGWITPILMLWTPYEAVSDAAVPTVRATRGRATASELPVLLRAWWVSFLLMLLSTLLPHGYTLGTDDHLPTVQNLSLLAVAATVISAVLWLRVVSRVTEAQSDVHVLALAVEAVRQAEAARQ
jgi:hypothetical protein